MSEISITPTAEDGIGELDGTAVSVDSPTSWPKGEKARRVQRTSPQSTANKSTIESEERVKGRTRHGRILSEIEDARVENHRGIGGRYQNGRNNEKGAKKKKGRKRALHEFHATSQ